jgi:hypothetical protein
MLGYPTSRLPRPGGYQTIEAIVHLEDDPGNSEDSAIGSNHRILNQAKHNQKHKNSDFSTLEFFQHHFA